MPVTLTPEQEASLDDSRKVFNRLTGRRFTLPQFVAHVIAEAVASNARTAELARPLIGRPLQSAKAVRRVH